MHGWIRRGVAMSWSLFMLGCAAGETDDTFHDTFDDVTEDTVPEDAGILESAGRALSANAIQAACSVITPAAPWTDTESELFRHALIEYYVDLKRSNDALINERGVGRYVGTSTELYKVVVAKNYVRAAEILRPRTRAGFDADAIAREIQGTSCIGAAYKALAAAHAAIGRSAEWAAAEKCARARGSVGLHLQTALIQGGWAGPTLGFITDASFPPGPKSEVDFARNFMRATERGEYYGTPVSTSELMKNFQPALFSPTRPDPSFLRRFAQTPFVAVGTIRAAYHVPLVVSGELIPEDFFGRSPPGTTYVLESHSAREAWDKTNFEIRPLSQVIGETLYSTIPYSTGTLLFAPGSGTLTPLP